ncbi:hypothetical protein CNMCM6805_000651 [Aspergillus fumigatiaffinis]|uniref:Subtelomeric hrmA-associated cluster protein AFUB-079030/YDR124W-like helical bundle domain-containing protein n=1 Tax=Aspergillus fumigatiaffinis TaxID=340414 RepID=A0A8H4MAV0_9EURO|nr:hypothetical protein CNMCM5878_005069 [Aspergillus fumigatiaffinis]KAF4230616.1 hypothetical protein CNMCM6805_000651 [Aspergillus fumigatiaffinis]KAF4238292.1 hypothetical protein CNMCM6457_010313 [Aspergillus fumigatiaffinis]
MVFSAPAPGVGSSKRPASCMQDDVSGWDNVPPMGLSIHSSINIPYAHYAMIYLDNMGNLKVMGSPSIKEQSETVFTPEVRESFLEILGAKVGYQPPMVRRLSAGGCGSVDMVELEIGDTSKVLAYYERSLKHFRQVNCRHILKAFIKFIEPRKQAKHPYNGGKPPAGAPPGKKGDPEKTKPEWWPANVVHKEPDHLRKDQRLSLLIHFIRKLGRFGITTDQLQEIAHDCKRQLSGPQRLQILDEVFGVRRIEECYDRGEVDANTIVYVVNRESNQKEKDGDSNVDPDQKHEQEDDNADEALPILRSEMNSTSPMSSSVEYTGMAAPSCLMNIGDDRNQLFPLPEWSSFGETTRDDQTFFPTTSEYTEDYASEQMPRTPATTGLVSPNETYAAFDYMTQESITSSAPEQISHHCQAPLPMQHSASFNPWTPPFQYNLFNPMVYGTVPSHAMSQTTILYQLPRSPTPHPKEMPYMAHGLPNLPQDRPSSMDGMSMRGPSFHTGSLSHPCDPSQQAPHSS